MLTTSNQAFGLSLLGLTIGGNHFMRKVSRPGSTLMSTLGLSKPNAPVAKKVPSSVWFGVSPDKPDEFRGKDAMSPPIEHKDPYFWLRDDDRKDHAVIEHLEAENRYCAAHMDSLSDLTNELYDEMISHMKETDEDVPYDHGAYQYYSKTVKGLSYKIHCRKLKTDPNSIEEIILDENKVAEGHDYSVVGGMEISPCHNYLAYAVDQTGYETYKIRIINLSKPNKNEYLSDEIDDTDGQICWGPQGTIFYIKMDTEHRPHELWYHHISSLNNNMITDDIMIKQENDSLFWMSMSKTHDDHYLLLSLDSSETSEQYIVDLKNTNKNDYLTNFILISEREYGTRYECEHHEKCGLIIVTNKDNAKSNKVCIAPLHGPTTLANDIQKQNWKDIKPYQSTLQINDVLPFKDHLIIRGREHGLPQLWIIDVHKKLDTWNNIKFSEEVYDVYTKNNADYNTSKLRYVYTSAITPSQTIDYNLKNGNKEILKEQYVPGYDMSQYECRRVFATGRDGVQIPMTIVAKKDIIPLKAAIKHDKPNKCLLIGYGSYGMSYDVVFNFKQLSLLDRGFIIATAHIRGGGEMGKQWHEDQGKYLNKMNTFNDFADCAKHLINTGYTTSNQLGISGRSAGGLLMGAVINRDPGLYKACIAGVPFVDCINTMSDPTIPLTVGEWEEWGNPNEEKYYEYMKSYSPYDNVVEQQYPSMLVTSGLNDPRVAYWEPAKWVAKIRDMRTNKDTPLYLKTEMSSGHFSFSDRYKHVKETAFEYSFLIEQLK